MEGDWIEEQVEDPYYRTAEDRLENNELGLAILECLDTLDERHASIFKMKTIDNFETEAICNEYNITPSNLWVIIHRARKAMANCLEKNWF